jgi:hypothetical protein
MAKQTDQGEIEIPGGVIIIDPYRKNTNRVWFWLRAISSIFWRGYFAAARSERDIVILDSSRSRELYRDGPYNSITIGAPLNQLLRDIQNQGLEKVIRTWQVNNAQLGTVQIEHVPVGSIRSVDPYISRARSFPRTRPKGSSQ